MIEPVRSKRMEEPLLEEKLVPKKSLSPTIVRSGEIDLGMCELQLFE